MVRLCWFILFCGLFSQFSINNKPSKVETVDGVAAIVEKNVILKSDVMQQAFMIAQQQGVDPSTSPSVFESVYVKTLDSMVDNLVLYELSLKDTNIVVDPLMVEESLNEEIKKRIEYAGSAKKLEDLFGEPLSMIRAKLRLEIKKAIRVEGFSGSIYQSINPSIVDVETFYNTYKDSLPPIQENVSFSVYAWPVSVNTDKEKEVEVFLSNLKNRVLDGESFYDLAAEHSDDVGSAPSGGRLGFFVRGSLFPEYEEVAFSLDPGQISDPFKSSVGYHIVLLEDRVGEKIKTSHILKLVETGDKDVEVGLSKFNSFLSEYDVYNSVEKFDSLCAHSPLSEGLFHGVFPKTPLSSLPDFLDKSLFTTVGYKDIFLENKILFLIRVWGYQKEQNVSFFNFYSELQGLTKNQLINDKISMLINKEKENLYIEKFY